MRSSPQAHRLQACILPVQVRGLRRVAPMKVSTGDVWSGGDDGLHPGAGTIDRTLACRRLLGLVVAILTLGDAARPARAQGTSRPEDFELPKLVMNGQGHTAPLYTMTSDVEGRYLL